MDVSGFNLPTSRRPLLATLMSDDLMEKRKGRLEVLKK